MKKGQYSKWLIPVVILLNVGFSIGIIIAMQKGMIEPTSLIDRWFDFTTVELLAMCGITVGKIGKDVLAGLFEVLKDKYKNKE